ncbi:MAG TPA: alpha/beta hydrolase [Amycolatopsis sp.]|jgi:pimeloyl-ACP methyl ester carboxylesterase|nr:alpha/beta hydrolase [Amycolatopsis sp.]
MRKAAILIVATLITTLVPLPVAADTGAPPCTRYAIPVSMTQGATADETVAGWVCGYGDLTGKPVELLIPGFTYNHSYWDFDYQPDTYSYLRSATQAGNAVVMIDRPGTGESSKPPATSLTIDNEAWAVHQVVQRLRAGELGSTFGKVVLVGHSLGGTVTQVEASTYHDVDAVIISDWLHSPYWVGTPGVIFGTLEPAQLVPSLADRPLGYLTTLSGVRGMFYDTQHTDPLVIAHDEATRDTGTDAEEATILAPTLDPTVTRGITVPTLLATGQYDFIFCGALTPCTNAGVVLAREAPNFSPQACLSAYVLPDAGHDINLEPGAPDWFTAANRWIGTVVGAEAAGTPDCARIQSAG